MTLLQSWSTKGGKPQLVRVSVQLFGVIIDTLKEGASTYIPTISGILRTETHNQAQRLSEAETSPDTLSELDWQLPYQLLTVWEKLLRVFPTFTSASDKVPWPAVVALLLFPHA